MDEILHVRALSREAERVFDVSESEALTRRVSELLVPADSVSPDRFALVAALAAAARGEARASRPMAVRRADEYGVRYSARIGPCHSGPAVCWCWSRLTTSPLLKLLDATRRSSLGPPRAFDPDGVGVHRFGDGRVIYLRSFRDPDEGLEAAVLRE